MIPQETPQMLHDSWCKHTDQQMHPRATERALHEAIQLGVTADDLRCAIQFMKAFNKRNDGAKFRINFLSVCGDTEKLVSLVAEARAHEKNRRPPPTPKEQVIAMRERQADPELSTTLHQTPMRSFKDVLEGITKQ